MLSVTEIDAVYVVYDYDWILGNHSSLKLDACILSNANPSTVSWKFYVVL